MTTMALRDLHLPLNQAQRVRLGAALNDLRALSAASLAAAVSVADTIPVNHGDSILKGHGTSDQNGEEVVATACGVVERVNKYVHVRARRARYKPKRDDIIVDRVVEVAPKRWMLDINSSQDAVLMLSSMHLPDGIQRRRSAVDELNMRSIFEENDIVCAEVGDFQNDGSLHLQVRSQKYGKLERGQLIIVPSYLVKQRNQHFHHLEQYDVDLILGLNGFIWVGEHAAVGENTDMMEDEQKLRAEVETFTPLETREHICRLANAVRVLSALGFTLTIELIIETAEASRSSNVEINEMLGAEFHVQAAEREAKRRTNLLRRENGAR